MRNAYKKIELVWLNRKEHSEDIGVDERIALKCMIGK
jgi:predicted metal-binding protein